MGYSQKNNQYIQRLLTRTTRTIESPKFGRSYAVFATVFLAATTLYWSILGARINLQNADQLVNPLLLEHLHTFRGALIPGSHSFLIKWPLFLLIRLLKFNLYAYVAVTVCTVLATVAVFAAILYKIERRPLVFGTIILALSSVMMAIPPSPYAGALLPVNMAMLTTRNIEYVWYILALIALTGIRRIASWKFFITSAFLALLFASDKLFLYLSLGGASAALVMYSIFKQWEMVKLSVRWIAATVAAGLISLAMLWLVSKTLAHVVLGSSTGPYGLTHSVHSLALAVGYGLLHIATNFGANPASQTTLFSQMPQRALSSLVGVSGISYVINFTLLLGALYAAYRLVRHSLFQNKARSAVPESSTLLAAMLLWSSIAAIVVFVLSNHYYAADARYLAIVMFSLFAASAVYLRGRIIQPQLLVGAGLICLIGTVLAIPTVRQTSQADQAALQPTSRRNSRIVRALFRHPGEALIGDYWRVVAIKSLDRSLAIVPLESCTAPRNTLTSIVWQHGAQDKNFAYLLSLDGSLTDFPHCSLSQVFAAYGRPDSTTVIAGSQTSPTEILLYYSRSTKH